MDILKIKDFLNIDGYGYGSGYGKGYDDGNGSGYGRGYGYGDGYGNGDGNGSGYGFAYGNGNGKGYGYGYGYGKGNGKGYGEGNGNGYGIKNINGYDVYNIDNIPTIFTHIRGNIAKGFILENNVILKPCYIIKGNGYFAHGESLKQAQTALEEKIIDNMDIEEKIRLFKDNFTDINRKYAVKEFYQWHHTLTGSCEMGRKSFANNHNINIEKDMMTVNEFMDLTENAYCGEIIKQLRESYEREE